MFTMPFVKTATSPHPSSGFGGSGADGCGTEVASRVIPGRDGRPANLDPANGERR